MIGTPREVAWARAAGARRAADPPEPRKVGGPCPRCGEDVTVWNRDTPAYRVECCTYCDWRD